MSVNVGYTVMIIAVCAACTLLERALPFLIFRGKTVPSRIEYLGGVLPMAIMMTLVFYCLKNVSFQLLTSWIPQLAASAVTVVLHLWKRNTLISIVGGTAACMLLYRII